MSSEQNNRTAVIETNKGTIKFRLYEKKAPITTANFISLAEQGFYDGLTFHRVEPGFVIQGGDPQGNGTGGSGKTIKLEVSPQLKHGEAGAVAMASSSKPDSASSQFYITLAPAPFLDGNYAVFGRVTEGLEVARQICVGDQMKSVRIIKSGVTLPESAEGQSGSSPNVPQSDNMENPDYKFPKIEKQKSHLPIVNDKCSICLTRTECRRAELYAIAYLRYTFRFFGYSPGGRPSDIFCSRYLGTEHFHFCPSCVEILTAPNTRSNRMYAAVSGSVVALAALEVIFLSSHVEWYVTLPTVVVGLFSFVFIFLFNIFPAIWPNLEETRVLEEAARKALEERETTSARKYDPELHGFSPTEKYPPHGWAQLLENNDHMPNTAVIKFVPPLTLNAYNGKTFLDGLGRPWCDSSQKERMQ